MGNRVHAVKRELKFEYYTRLKKKKRYNFHHNANVEQRDPGRTHSIPDTVRF